MAAALHHRFHRTNTYVYFLLSLLLVSLYGEWGTHGHMSDTTSEDSSSSHHATHRHDRFSSSERHSGSEEHHQMSRVLSMLRKLLDRVQVMQGNIVNNAVGQMGDNF